VFGDNVEDRLGHFKFLIFYLATGLAASWAHVATNMDGQIPTIGASGAIAGVLGAYILLYPRSRIRTLVMFVFITVLRVPAVFLLGFWFLLQVFSGVGSLGTTANLSGGVAYWAHVGGFAAGVLGIFLYLRVTGQPIRPPTWRSTET
jgi:membrane associated rhomboid family serine protease